MTKPILVSISLETLQKLLSDLYASRETLEEITDMLDLMIRNARLAPHGLSVGDELFFTDEYLSLTGLDQVPGAANYRNHSEILCDFDHDYLSLGYRGRDGLHPTSGHPHISLRVVQGMKQAADERRKPDKDAASA